MPACRCAGRWAGLARRTALLVTSESIQRLEASPSCSRWGGRVATSRRSVHRLVPRPSRPSQLRARRQRRRSGPQCQGVCRRYEPGSRVGLGSSLGDWAQAALAPRRRQSESDLRRQRGASRVAISARSPLRRPHARRVSPGSACVCRCRFSSPTPLRRPTVLAVLNAPLQCIAAELQSMARSDTRTRTRVDAGTRRTSADASPVA